MQFSFYATKDNAEGQLNTGISAAALSIPLKAGGGARFPQPITGTATASVTGTQLVDTGIGATGIAVGDFIENTTDGSHAWVTAVNTNDISTTQLIGGSDNTWQNGDVWYAKRFIVTLNQRDANGAITASEKVRISGRSTDTLTVRSGDRGFDGSAAQSFLADDYVSLFSVSKHIETLQVAVSELSQLVQNLSDQKLAITTDTTQRNANKRKQPVRAATTGNITIATGLNDGDTLDGVTLVTGDRVLVKDQSSGAENGIYCVDPETEILTRRGWRKYDDILKDDETLTFNLATGFSEWQIIQSVHSFEVKDVEMMSFENRHHSSLTTMNHRWVVDRKTHHGGDKYSQGYAIRESHELVTADYIIRAAVASDIPTTKKYDDTFVELIAWFITEGHIRKNNSGTLSDCVRIVQSSEVNPQNVERIRNALTAVFGQETPVLKRQRNGVWNPEWRQREQRAGMPVFELNSRAGAILCEAAPDRVPTIDFICSLTLEQLHLFIDTCVAGDGCIAPNGQKTFGQSDTRRHDVLQIAAALAGVSVGRRMYASEDHCQVTLQKDTRTQPHMNGKKVVRYSGVVWCPKTENSTWFARRNGMTFFTGNTVAVSPSRAADFDENNEVAGADIWVQEGTVNADTLWLCTNNGTPTVGTTALTFAQRAANTVDDTAYDATSWNGVTTLAPSKNAVRDELETMKTILPAQKVLQTTRAMNAASSNVTLAHGLGRTPKYINVMAKCKPTGSEAREAPTSSDGWSNGTNHACSYVYKTAYNSPTGVGQNNTHCVYIDFPNSYGAQSQKATASFDGTNVTLAFTGVVPASPYTDTIHLTVIVFG